MIDILVKKNLSLFCRPFYFSVTHEVSLSRRRLFFNYYWHIYPPITRKQRSAVRARLEVAGHLSTTLKWGSPVKCLFPTAQQVNLPACPPHCPLNAERQAGKL